MPWNYYAEEGEPGVRSGFPILPVWSGAYDPMVEASKSNYLRFKTYSSIFSLDKKEVDDCINPDNYAHPNMCYRQPYRLKIFNSRKQVVGTVTVPRSVTERLGGNHEFIVLSRKTLIDDIRNELYQRDVKNPPPTREWSGDITREEVGGLFPITGDEMAMSPDFDCRVFDVHKPWPLYRVMLIERMQHDVAYRRGLGKIHVDGFWEGSL